MIQVRPGEDVGSVLFQRQIERTMADYYNQAIIKEDGYLSGGTSGRRRRKRAVTVGNATVQV